MESLASIADSLLQVIERADCQENNFCNFDVCEMEKAIFLCLISFVIALPSTRMRAPAQPTRWHLV